MIRQKRVVVINDLSGLGKCSLTVSISILSALNIQPCPIPTAILSNQTQFNEYSFYDFTNNMKDYIKIWEKQKENFDAIYTGFLGSYNQINIILEFIKKQRDTLIIVDPVMGDNGEIYETYNKDMCNKMKELVSLSYIVTPNITEACILADEKLDIENLTNDYLKRLGKKIANLGPKYVIITGIINKNKISNILYDKEKNEIYRITTKFNNTSYSGTGDIFASMLTALILNGNSVYKSMEITTNFISKAIEYTNKFKINPNYGIYYEKFLREVII